MRQPNVPIVQLALDYATIDEALRMAEIGVKAGVDILEAGTPLIVSQGVGAVGRLARAFPNYPILADYKTMDSGGKNVALTKQQGGHYMTVCANAADETVQAAVKAKAENPGVQVVVDTIGVKDMPARSRLCEQWGVDMIYLHYAADQWRADMTRDGTYLLEPVLDAVKIPVGIGTFGVKDATWAVAHGASLVAIGHPLITVADPLTELTRFVQQVKASHKAR
jgi:3-hexulose-6-phosphate synthase